MLQSNTKCLVTFMYAMNLPSERAPLWDDLKVISASVNLPWLLMGDFNTTLLYDERIKGGVINDSDTSELSSFVQEADVMDLRFTG